MPRFRESYGIQETPFFLKLSVPVVKDLHVPLSASCSGSRVRRCLFSLIQIDPLCSCIGVSAFNFAGAVLLSADRSGYPVFGEQAFQILFPVLRFFF